ncbi:MAG: hypothetical protein ACM3SU_01345 [Acidobacteriota bacterium]
MSVEQFLSGYPSAVDAQTVAIMNEAEPGTSLEAGRLMKSVTGAPLP